jgi:serine/threonine-protein kinase
MEYLDGCDLSELAEQRGPLPASEAVEYVMQACEGLAEAHSLGIVHRDVKLANLFVTRGHAGAPLVKVLDFGISKVNPFGESEQDMTRSASMLGSPRFMSPEQMRDARAVDARSDLWSLGVVLYRLVAGRPPFEAATLGRLLAMVMYEPHDALSLVRSDLPPGFEAVVARCLQKEPKHRFANVAELAHALAPFAVDPLRARDVADRVAQTLGLGPMLPSSALPPMWRDGAPPPGASLGRSSHFPPGSDTGTGAPWAGTHGGAPRAERARGSLVAWAAVALAAACILALLFVKVRPREVAGDEAAHVLGAPAQAEPPVPPAAALPAARVLAPAGLAAPPAGPSATASADVRRRALSSAPQGTPRKPPRATPPSSTAATTGGIPSTRD